MLLVFRPQHIGSSMNFVLQPWQLLLLILAGWINRQQQQVIDYLRTENQILKEKLGKRRILLTDDQRRRLAVQANVLGSRNRKEVIQSFFVSAGRYGVSAEVDCTPREVAVRADGRK